MVIVPCRVAIDAPGIPDWNADAPDRVDWPRFLPTSSALIRRIRPNSLPNLIKFGIAVDAQTI
jgi:hypothetical protein